MSRPSRITPRGVALAALVLLLALTPFLPRGGHHAPLVHRADRRTHALAPTVGYGRITPAAQRTIDRLAGESYAAGRTGPATRTRTLVDEAVRCAVFEGQRYCLGTG